jgi:hypothetical protein
MNKELTLEEAASILGIDKNSNFDEIKKSYRSKVMQFHPDKTQSSDCKEFIRITEAYELLSSKLKDGREFDYDYIFEKYTKNKSKEGHLDLDQIINIMSNPQILYSFINDITEKGRPKKIDHLVNILEREDYKTARKFFESDKSYALNDADSIIKTLQNNICKKSFYELKLPLQLDELSYYCTKLKQDYKKSVEDIAGSILGRTKDYVMNIKDIRFMNAKIFDEYLNENFSLLDKTPLDTEHIEEEFKNDILKKLNGDIFSGYTLNRIKSSIEKICILDEYYSSEDEPHALLNQSYESFIRPWRGEIIPKYNREKVYGIIQEYAVKGVFEAKKLNSTVRIMHRV